jgi:hypothetical protein
MRRDDARPIDAEPADLIDGPPNMIDAPPPVCGNGVVESAEECELGTVTACATSCGDTGSAACNQDCTLASCVVTIESASAWEVSSNGTLWSGTALPNVGWPCDNCTRYFRTRICDQPSAVEFRWSSDNRARMTVNGTVAFNTYWVPGYCTDAPCCAKCCDSSANCMARLSAPQVLSPAALMLFNPGANTMRWEIEEEVGGSGFYTVMTVRY